MPNDVALEAFYGGAWHDLVADGKVLAEQPITVQRGDGSESAAPRPSSLVARLNNDTDRFRTSNPMSPLYGKAGRNTPVRLRVGGVVRGYAEASSWRDGQTRDYDMGWLLGGRPKRGKAWVDLEAGGLLRRINQWTEPLRSPLTRGTLALPSLIGLWPLEDNGDAAQLSQSVPGAQPGTYSGSVTIGDNERPGGATQTAKLDTEDSLLAGQFRATAVSGWQICFAVKLAALPASATYLPLFRWRDSAGRTWEWRANTTHFAFHVSDDDGTTLSYTSSTFGSRGPDQWTRCRVKVTVSGSTVTHEPAWYVEGDTVASGNTFTFAGTTTGRPVSWEAPGNVHTVDANYCNVFALGNAAVDIIANSDVLAAFNGHVGETTRARFVRIMNEMGLAHSVVGTSTTRMGAQPAASLPELLREIRDTEDGLIYDAADAIALVFKLRTARYSQTPVTLDVTELPVPPPEVTDDLNTHNRVTVANLSGAEATAEDSSGPLGTQDAPAGVGVYEQTVDVNVADDGQLPELANWWLRRGTVDLPRYPQVEVNLAKLSPAKAAQVEALDVGGVIAITGYRENVIRLQILGLTETVGWPNARRIVFACVPDQQFDVGVYNSPQARYDAYGSTLTGAQTATSTSWAVTVRGAQEAWSNTAVPYDWIVAGERVTVTVITAPGGTSQTATVIRSVNGVVKAHTAGTPIEIASSTRYAY